MKDGIGFLRGLLVVVFLIPAGCATVQTDVKDAEGYYSRGMRYFARFQFDQAISDFTKALEINPTFADVYAFRGHAYRAKGQYDHAISDYTKELEIRPRDLVYANRGLAYHAKGQYDQAISDFTKALEINPKFGEAYADRAKAYYFKKDYDKAWDDVKKAQDLGGIIPSGFLKDLRQASGRER